MRKFIQAFALFTVFVAFSAVAANAQINYGAEVKIPFAFSVNEKSYDAGTYIIKLNRQIAGGAALTIQKDDSHEIQTIMLSENGGARSGAVKLVFNVDNGSRYLAGLTTTNNSYAFVRAKELTQKTGEVGADGGDGANLF